MKKVLFHQRSSGKSSKGRHRRPNRLVQALKSVPRCELPPERRIVRLTADPSDLDNRDRKRVLRYIGATGCGDKVKVTADVLIESYPDMNSSEPELFDHLTRRERMSSGQYARGAEWSVGPLRRFLRSMVGQPWREVEAALRCKVGNEGDALFHLRDFLENLVLRNVHVCDDGAVQKANGDCACSHGTDRFFVHPHTGKLEKLPQRPRSMKQDSRHFEQVPLNERQKLVKLSGIWYVIDFERIPQADTLPWDAGHQFRVAPRDIVLRKEAVHDPRYDWNSYSGRKPLVKNYVLEDFISEWGAPIYAERKQQANSAMLRAHGVRND